MDEQDPRKGQEKELGPDSHYLKEMQEAIQKINSILESIALETSTKRNADKTKLVKKLRLISRRWEGQMHAILNGQYSDVSRKIDLLGEKMSSESRLASVELRAANDLWKSELKAAQDAFGHNLDKITESFRASDKIAEEKSNLAFQSAQTAINGQTAAKTFSWVLSVGVTTLLIGTLLFLNAALTTRIDKGDDKISGIAKSVEIQQKQIDSVISHQKTIDSKLDSILSKLGNRGRK